MCSSFFLFSILTVFSSYYRGVVFIVVEHAESISPLILSLQIFIIRLLLLLHYGWFHLIFRIMVAHFSHIQFRRYFQLIGFKFEMRNPAISTSIGLGIVQKMKCLFAWSQRFCISLNFHWFHWAIKSMKWISNFQRNATFTVGDKSQACQNIL